MVPSVSDLTPSPWTYLLDLTLSAAFGWSLLALAMLLPHPEGLLLLLPASLLLYRAFMFLHELCHLRRPFSDRLSVLWNAICGVPFLCPSFLYVGVHQIHHSPKFYGSARDHEYVDLSGRRGVRAALYVLGASMAPLLLVVRALVLVPGGWVSPGLRAFTMREATALAMRSGEARTQSSLARTPGWRAWELLTTAVALGLAAVMLSGAWRPVAIWFAAATIIAFLNSVASILLHGYGRFRDERVDRMAQAADSWEMGESPLWVILAPLGLAFHATHHVYPGTPYHHLRAARRRLLAACVLPGFPEPDARRAQSANQIGS